MTDRIRQDIRVALRGFRRSPTFAITAVLILGVGIGMTVAIWAVFNAVLLRPPPVSDPDHIVIARLFDSGGNELAAGREDLAEMRQISRTMRVITGYDSREAINFPMTDGDRPLPLAGAQVDGRFFDVLGVRPLIGRLLNAEDDTLASGVVQWSFESGSRALEVNRLRTRAKRREVRCPVECRHSSTRSTHDILRYFGSEPTAPTPIFAISRIDCSVDRT